MKPANFIYGIIVFASERLQQRRKVTNQEVNMHIGLKMKILETHTKI